MLDNNKIDIHKSGLEALIDIDDAIKDYWVTMLMVVPNITKTENYSIQFYTPGKNQPVGSLYRFCSKYVDDCFGVQDELFFPGENEGGQMNFELDANLKLIKYPSKLTKYHIRLFERIKQVIKMKGSKIYVQGYGYRFISDGEKWVKYTEEIEKSINKIDEGLKQLEQ